jgi:hypothetical protein
MSNQTMACITCRPKSHFTEQNGFIPKLMQICVRELRKAGFPVRARELQEEVMKSKSFGNALAIMSKHLNMD